MNYELLADVAQVIMGQSPPSSTYNAVGEGLPFYQGKTDFGDMYPTPRIYCTEPSRIAEAGDILISVRAPVGPTNISQERSCIGRGISAIRVGKNLDRDFLLYFLRFYEPELAKAGTGSTFTAISREDLETIKIPLPPLTEQKRIASLLARADRLRQLRRTAHDLSDALLQSVFLDFFGEEEKQNYLSIQDLMDSEAIIDMQDGNHGGDYPRSAEFVSEGIPFLTATNVIGNRVFLESAPRLKPERAHKLRIGWVKPNDVLLSHNATVGRVAVMPHFEGEVVLGTSLTYYRLNPGIFLPRYFAYVFQSRHFQAQLESFMGQTTRNQVPITRQRELFVPEPPPLSLQEEFAGVVARVESLRGRMGESTRGVEGLFESLLAEAFS